MDDDALKKNILDLHFHKYLIIASTSIIISFTYLIGVGVAYVTNQIKLDDFVSMTILFIFSTALLGLCAFFFFKAYYHIKNILSILKNMKLK